MSRISLISGIPADEIPQRAAVARTVKPYIPYTDFTKGQMLLALAEERARIYAAVYPETAGYHEAATMYENALYQGVHKNIGFTGVLTPAELQAAELIVRANKMTRPATRGVILSANKVINGVKIGAGPISTQYDCEQIAADEMNQKYNVRRPISGWKNSAKAAERREWWERSSACDTRKEIQNIVNNRLESSAHHVLYNRLSDGFTPLQGTRADTKRLLQGVGISAIAGAVDMDRALISDWTENGVLRINSATPQIGLMGSEQSGLYVAGNDDAYWKAYKSFKAGDSTEMNALLRLRGQPQVGVLPLVVASIVAILGAIAQALNSAGAFQKELNNKKNGAFASAQAYGTPELSAAKGDIITQGGAGGGLNNNTMLLLGGAAVGLYLLTSK